jgi:hypothetical protein
MTKVWRVRKLSCDGNVVGREWSCELFTNADKANKRLNEIIANSDKRNPNHKFNTKIEAVENVVGLCNWQFGLMVSIDEVIVT